MILKMEKLFAFGLLEDKDAILRALMRRQCVQVISPESLDDYEELKALTQGCEAQVYALEQQLSRYNAALAGISPYTTKGGMFAQKPRVEYDKLEDVEQISRADALCEKIEAALNEISSLRSQKGKDVFLRTSLEPWADSDVPLDFAGTTAVSAARYLLPAKTEMQELEARQLEAAPASVLQVVSVDREQQYLLVLCHREQEDALWEVLKEFGAAKATFTGLTGTASENIAQCDKRMLLADTSLEAQEQQLRELGQDVAPLKHAYDALSVQIQRGKVSDDMRSTGKTFCFTGWVPETSRDTATAILDRFGCCYELKECAEDEEAPILLKNNRWATPYESVTQMYSLPAYHGFDPNNFVSFFYFLFFGMMLSDAGFGLILFFGGMWLQKKMDLGPSAKKLVKVISWGGLSAIIWGTIFGSWFGDIIPVIGEEFFGIEGIQVFQLIDPLTQAVVVMGISLALGLVHILIGMGIKAYILVKRGHTLDAVFDVGFWYLVLIGLTLCLCNMIFDFVPEAVMTIGAAMAVLGAVGLVFTQGRNQKNPIMRIGTGIISLYDITGYFSDVLSYSRILALGLATGVIAQVVNIMGTLAGGGILGAIVFILVFIVGSALNLGINTLGAYVHTARLQYVEFFGKFYEAGGRPFVPVMPQTKYVVVTNKEE